MAAQCGFDDIIKILILANADVDEIDKVPSFCLGMFLAHFFCLDPPLLQNNVFFSKQVNAQNFRRERDPSIFPQSTATPMLLSNSAQWERGWTFRTW